MNESLIALCVTAASLGLVHTLAGPDHYLPFIVMAKARKWGYLKTVWITVLCGLGHVGSSIVLGFIGIAFGLGVARLEIFEGYRGSVAAWLFILFGLGYFIWGLIRGIRNKKHQHLHIHKNKEMHYHGHQHEHTHEHHDVEGVPEAHDHEHKVNMTPWILFTIFVFGPCEPLIPLLMYPAAQKSVAGTVVVSGVFSVVTITTMVTMVLLPLFGLKLFPTKWLERYMHAIAGATVLICGLGIEFLGL
jgi:ABC-type nickel/cobalt efflux system permease component RcnA